MGGGTGKRRPRRGWTRYSTERLLDMRLCDLDLRLSGTWVERCVELLHEELERRGILFRPHAWLSTEWFSPDGVPGIAIPFYLVHPRLMRLERQQMLEVEGGSEQMCMRILRHEAGHAIDSAYRLHWRAEWRRTFGSFRQPYPDTYVPRPKSRNYVLHLGSWYAQAHPSEDFAETFAVWLGPRSGWRERYREWPRALRKLLYVDREMKRSVIGKRALVRSMAMPDRISEDRQTLRDYYASKHHRYEATWPTVYDRDLRLIFSDAPRYRSNPTAFRFLRQLRVALRETVVQWTSAHPYTVDHVLGEMMERCRDLRLRIKFSTAKTRLHAHLLLTVHTMRCLHLGRFEIPL